MERRTAEDLIDGRLSWPQLKEIVSHPKDPDRFQVVMDVLRERLGWQEPILLPLADHLYVVQKGTQRVVEDMDGDIFSERIAEDVFGVVASRDEKQDKWTLDEKATGARRQELRGLRAERSLPYEEFWRQERERIEEGQLGEPVRGMLRESMGLSQAWAQEFRAFWKLPEGFQP